MTQEKFKQWGVIELFGHTRIAGEISEQTIGGSSFIRIDVPPIKDGEVPGFTRFLGSGAIYAINPCDEASARMMAENLGVTPINAYDFSDQFRKAVEKRVAQIGATQEARRMSEYEDDAHLLI